MSRLTDKQLAARLRGIGASQELALMAFAEDGSCTEYLIEAASRLENAPDCAECEGSGESGQIASDGTQYSTKTPPCTSCGGSGKTERPALEVAAHEMLEALQCLLPGLVLDLRYADDDEDKDALRSRIETVQSAIDKALGR